MIRPITLSNPPAIFSDNWCYDVNVFSTKEDLQLDKIQPSIYYEVERDGDYSGERIYLEAFYIPASEQRVIRKAFPINSFGSDFFTTLEEYQDLVKGGAPLVDEILSQLPRIDHQLDSSKLDYNNHGEVKWLPKEVANYEC